MVPPIVTSCHAELTPVLINLLNHTLQQHPQGTCLGILALELSSPRHGAWPSPLVLFSFISSPGTTRVRIHHPHWNFVGLDVKPGTAAFQALGWSCFQPCRRHKTILSPRCATPAAPLSASMAMSESVSSSLGMRDRTPPERQKLNSPSAF